MNLITLERNDEILTILAEECAEVIQACSKIKRFGLGANVEALAKELGDLQCMIELVYEYKVVPHDLETRLNYILNKRIKLKSYSSIFNHD